MITKSSIRPNAKSGFRRISYGISLLLLLTLTGCGQLVPEIGDFREKIPEALSASSLGITAASAGKISTNQQFNITIVVDVALDRETVTTEEVEETLTIIAPLIDQPLAYDLQLTFYTNESMNYEYRVAVSEAIMELNKKWLVLTGEKPGNGTFGSSRPDEDEAEVSVTLSNLREYVHLLEKQ